ncbi:hypothetical protein T12_14055 [Trichinella patagoniensis]|uniref:Uncharacterized protein n=1 Tax=Trichinella patagoniensis TaxID=990121 RepID=A0A0V0YT40_9BILA|nr:hypothetical protein T12_14055 [Trichinella patagoniensis]
MNNHQPINTFKLNHIVQPPFVINMLSDVNRI